MPTAAVVNYLVTHDGVCDDLVYQMTKAIFENLDRAGGGACRRQGRSSSRARSTACRCRCIRAPSAIYKEKGVMK